MAVGIHARCHAICPCELLAWIHIISPGAHKPGAVTAIVPGAVNVPRTAGGHGRRRGGGGGGGPWVIAGKVKRPLETTIVPGAMIGAMRITSAMIASIASTFTGFVPCIIV